jgi:hypothetical protein
MTTSGWWTVVWSGNGVAPAFGPWRDVEQARAAILRWEEKVAGGGVRRTVTSVAVRGPYSTRALARAADISKSPR